MQIRMKEPGIIPVVGLLSTHGVAADGSVYAHSHVYFHTRFLALPAERAQEH